MSKNICILISFLSLSIFAGAQVKKMITKKKVYQLYTSTVENPPSETKNEKGHIFNVSNSTLTVYLPEKKETERNPVLLLVPGGGYSLVDIIDYGESWVDYFTKQGFTCAILKYRIVGDFQQRVNESLKDAQKAIGILRMKSKKLGIDPNKIGVVGTSAGSHLCLNIINDKTIVKGKEPDFVCLLCAWPGKNNTGYFSFTKYCPPTYMAVAKDDDSTYDFVKGMSKKLQCNPISKLIEFEKGGHNIFNIRTGLAKDWYLQFNQWCQDNIVE
jgi:acetyl esterase/lipase